MSKTETENLIENLNSIVESLNSLEDSIVKEIELSKTETESVLKQLATYLNIAAQNIFELQKSSEKFSSSIDSFNNDIGKIDSIENKVLELPITGLKIRDEIINNMDEIARINTGKFNQLASYIKKLGQIINIQNLNIEKLKVEIIAIKESSETSKIEILKSQDKLVGIIKLMISSDKDLDRAQIEQGTAKIGAEAKKHKATMQLWQKIVGAVLGAGGFLYFIIDIIRGIGG